MLTAVILVPALLCCVALLLDSPARALRNVVLPVLIFCPTIYYWKVALLPPILFAEGVLLPLGVAMVLRQHGRWRWTWMDACVFLFWLSAGVADRGLGQTTASIFEWWDALCLAVIPYMAGKLLIEQEGARVATVGRTVLLMVAGALIGSYEFFAKDNPFQMFWRIFFRDPTIYAAELQVRHGFGRASAGYTDAELAGIMMIFGVLLVLWLGRYGGWGVRFRELPWLAVTKGAAGCAVLVMALLMTQSRGPELGCAVAVPVALVGRSRQVLRNGLLVLLLLGLGGLAAYVYAQRFSAVTEADPATVRMSEEEQTAAYRAIMLKNYLPMAENAGPFGLGPHFPRIGEEVSLTGVQFSIDNEYLFCWLTQGWVGLGAFCLLALGAAGRLVWVGVYGPEVEDRAFAWTLLGIEAGVLVTIATVYLGMQTICFFFLLLGWAQALPVRRAAVETGIERVYT